MTDNEKFAIRKECKKFILKDEVFSKKSNLCKEEDQEWLLNYLSTGKGNNDYRRV